MKKVFRAGALVLAILGFVVFFSVNSHTEWHLRKKGILPDEMQPSKVYRVGLEPSPWLTYKIDELLPDGSTYSGTDLYPLSWSWWVLAAAIASVWATTSWPLRERFRQTGPWLSDVLCPSATGRPTS